MWSWVSHFPFLSPCFFIYKENHNYVMGYCKGLGRTAPMKYLPSSWHLGGTKTLSPFSVSAARSLGPEGVCQFPWLPGRGGCLVAVFQELPTWANFLFVSRPFSSIPSSIPAMGTTGLHLPSLQISQKQCYHSCQALWGRNPLLGSLGSCQGSGWIQV